MGFACHYDIPTQVSTIRLCSHLNDPSVEPVVVRLPIDEQVDLAANSVTTHQLLEDKRLLKLYFISLSSDEFIIKYDLKLITKEGWEGNVSKSELLKDRCPKVVDKISLIKENE